VFVIVELPLEDVSETKISGLKLCPFLLSEDHAPSVFIQISTLAADVKSVDFQLYWTISPLFQL
jgi:hypothetical protein